MKRTVTTALIAAFLMVFGLSTGAFAQGMGHMGMGHMGMGMGGTQLSPEKQAAIQKIYQESRARPSSIFSSSSWPSSTS